MIRTVIVLLAIPHLLGGQQPASRSGGPVPLPVIALGISPPMNSRDTAGAALFRTVMTNDSTAERKLVRYTITGLATGAVIGAAGGAIGSRYAGWGCSDTEKTIGFALWFGALGAGAGAILGALVGLARDYGW